METAGDRATPLTVLTGTCKWFNSQKGFGFLTTTDGQQDVFVHQSVIHAQGFRSLAQNEPVEFSIVYEQGGRSKAINVTGPGGTYVKGAARFNPGFGGRFRQRGNFGGGGDRSDGGGGGGIGVGVRGGGGGNTRGSFGDPNGNFRRGGRDRFRDSPRGGGGFGNRGGGRGGSRGGGFVRGSPRDDRHWTT